MSDLPTTSEDSRGHSRAARQKATLTPGTRIKHYRVVRRLGAGGMGEVYSAEDETLGRVVALKILPPDLATDPTRLERFKREARTLASLNHPGIVTIFAVEHFDGLHFLSMELIDGTTLDKAIPRGGLRVLPYLEIALALTDALNAAHVHGIIHRDLKPQNIMVTARGRIKVVDFGVARPPISSRADTLADLQPASHSRLTAGNVGPAIDAQWLTGSDEIIGTLPYMSPEQISGQSVDNRSDIFSLGAVLHEMATSSRLFDGPDPQTFVSKILNVECPRISALRPDLPGELDSIVQRCLQTAPTQRFQTIAELHAALWRVRSTVAPTLTESDLTQWSRDNWSGEGVITTAPADNGWRPIEPYATVVPEQFVKTTLRTEDTFGTFELLDKLGTDEVFEVFLARHRGLDGFEKVVAPSGSCLLCQAIINSSARSSKALPLLLS